jgi:hypothetical protein
MAEAVCSTIARTMVSQSARSTVTRSLERQQLRIGDLVGQRLAGLEREHRIRGPVDHQCRRGDRGQRLA